MIKRYNALTCIFMAGMLSLLGACGGSGGGNSSSNGSSSNGSSSNGSSTQNSSGLSADQQIYEDEELHGGAFSLGMVLPYGGGNLVSGTNYAYSSTSGGISASPLTAGVQTEAISYATLDSALALPPVAPSRYLHNGQIVVRSATAQRLISYVGSSVHIDYLADDGVTLVQSSQFSDFSEVPLSGLIENAPEELQADYQFSDWISANNFSANARWQTGSFYTKRHGALVGDNYTTQDCANTYPLQTTTTAAVTPCMYQTTLDNFFPIALLATNGRTTEIDSSSDGTISTINGVRTWIANAPLPAAVNNITSYRIYYELNGNVYMGLLEKDGTAYNYAQADGSIVNYYIGLNQTAVNSIQQGLITGATTAGSQAGSTAEISSTVDLFGIGGHGVNGALAPVDLQTHYGLPATLIGTGQTIAIIDAPSSANIADDLNVYSQYFNLPQCNTANPCFQHIDLSNGAAIPAGADWGVEPDLDVQMVHAIAPGAKIILVTASAATQNALFAAINYAAALPGISAVTMSFGYSPAITDAQAQDALFSGFQTGQGISFFASSGDVGYLFGYATYPAASPFVTAVGGTRINAVGSSTMEPSEVAWQFSGGGNSNYAPIPSWQKSYLTSSMITGNNGMRAVPDIAAVADGQHSAVGVYYKQRWVIAGGTSVSSPIWAGMYAIMGQYMANKGSSLPNLIKATPGGFNGLLYQTKMAQGTNSGINDILSGSNLLYSLPCTVCNAVAGYDDVDGLGAPFLSQFLVNF